jgi:hypothetical protein
MIKNDTLQQSATSLESGKLVRICGSGDFSGV